MKRATCPVTGAEYSNQLDLDFYKAISSGRPRDALFIAAVGNLSQQLGLYHLQIAVREISRLEQIECPPVDQL